MKTKQLEIRRIAKRPNYTIGKLFIEGEYFCDTLEDAVRELKDLDGDGDLSDPEEGKLYGQTAILAGIYKVILSMSARFGRILPLLLQVLGFDGIRMHAGNTTKDTLGCILVGKNTSIGMLTQSRVTETALIEKLQSFIDEGYEIELTIK